MKASVILLIPTPILLKWMGRLLQTSKLSEFWHIFKALVFHQVIKLQDQASSYVYSGVTSKSCSLSGFPGHIPPGVGMRPQRKPLFHILPLEENANAEAERTLQCALISLDDQRIRTSKCTAESREMLPGPVDTAWECTYTLSTLRSPALTVAEKDSKGSTHYKYHLRYLLIVFPSNSISICS